MEKEKRREIKGRKEGEREGRRGGNDFTVLLSERCIS